MMLGRVKQWFMGYCPKDSILRKRPHAHAMEFLGVYSRWLFPSYMTALILLIIFPLATNLIMMTSPIENYWEIYLEKPEREMFSEDELESIRGIEGVFTIWRCHELWMRNGYILGIEFDKVDLENYQIIMPAYGNYHELYDKTPPWYPYGTPYGFPLLKVGKYPDDAYSVILNIRIATELNVTIDSKISFLGKEFKIVGLCNWIQHCLALIPYNTLIELRDNFNLEGDLSNLIDTSPLYYLKEDASESHEFLFCDLTSYELGLQFLDKIPEILNVHESYVDNEIVSLQSLIRRRFFRRLSKPIYGLCFVTIGTFGFLALLRKKKMTREFWLSITTLLFSISFFYISTFHNDWIATNLPDSYYLYWINLINYLIPILFFIQSINSILEIKLIDASTVWIGIIIISLFRGLIERFNLNNYEQMWFSNVIFPLALTLTIILGTVSLSNLNILGRIKTTYWRERAKHYKEQGIIDKKSS